jgi:lipopolysaccharide biosynthesis glycosyltransferase
MKKLIFQINVPNYSKNHPSNIVEYGYNESMYEVSNRYAKNYAEKVGADYYLLSDPHDYTPAAHKHLDYQKLKIYDFLNYDVVLYMDSDYIIKDNAPNLFELCKDQFHAVLDQGSSTVKRAEELSMPVDRYFNAGLMYLPKYVMDQTKHLVQDYLKEDYILQGQGLLNKLFYNCNITINSLNYMEWNPVKRTFGVYADHYSGNKKSRWGSVKY